MNEDKCQYENSAETNPELIELLNTKEELCEMNTLLQSLASKINDFNSLESRIKQFHENFEFAFSAEKPRPKENQKRFISSFVCLLITLLLVAVALASYSLNNSFKLNQEWARKVKEKMQSAMELERTIIFFKKTKEKENARQPD
jgi:hypothetical protein